MVRGDHGAALLEPSPYRVAVPNSARRKNEQNSCCRDDGPGCQPLQRAQPQPLCLVAAPGTHLNEGTHAAETCICEVMGTCRRLQSKEAARAASTASDRLATARFR